MKKILLIAFCAFATLAVSAQYAPMQVGKVMTYQVKKYGDHPSARTATSTVDSIGMADGISVAYVTDHTDTSGTLDTEPDTHMLYRYTTAEAPTTIVLMTPDEFKAQLLEMVRQQIMDAGQMVSDADMAEISNSMRPSGKLQLVIDPAAADGAKIPSASMRLSMNMFTMAMHLTNCKYLGKETITVPAGEFECAKIQYVYKFNAGTESERVNVTAWYAPGIGLVKEEDRTKQGEMVSEQILTAVSE